MPAIYLVNKDYYYWSASEASCGGYRTATAMQQSIKSPGYDSPRYYNSLLKCAWRIQVRVNSKQRNPTRCRILWLGHIPCNFFFLAAPFLVPTYGLDKFRGRVY